MINHDRATTIHHTHPLTIPAIKAWSCCGLPPNGQVGITWLDCTYLHMLQSRGAVTATEWNRSCKWMTWECWDRWLTGSDWRWLEGCSFANNSCHKAGCWLHSSCGVGKCCKLIHLAMMQFEFKPFPEQGLDWSWLFCSIQASLIFTAASMLTAFGCPSVIAKWIEGTWTIVVSFGYIKPSEIARSNTKLVLAMPWLFESNRKAQLLLAKYSVRAQ